MVSKLVTLALLVSCICLAAGAPESCSASVSSDGESKTSCESAASESTVPSEFKDDFSEEEWDIRVKLAAAYRLLAHFGWDEIIYNHITYEVPVPEGTPEGEQHFLINPFGLLYEEMTASSFVKINITGELIHEGYSPVEETRGVSNFAGFVIHSAIHEARGDEALCVIHTHHPDVIAVSAFEEGLMPIGQAYYVVGDIRYHDYEGFAVDEAEKKTLARDFESPATTLILRNHGLISVGNDVGSAFMRMYYAHKAAEMQVRTYSIAQSRDEIIFPTKEVQKIAKDFIKGSPSKISKQKSYPFGTLEFNALMRKIDRIDPSYRS